MKRRTRNRVRAVLSRLVLGGVAAGLAGLLTTSLPASAQQSDALRIVAVDSTNHPQVVLTVEPPATLAGEDLGAADFRLTEDGETIPIDVTRVGSESTASEAALEIMLVLDTSGSMEGEPLDAARDAAIAFLAEMPPGARVGLIAFGSTPVLASPLSNDRAEIASAIGALDASGETALYDALPAALDQFAAESTARQVIVLLSDGGDTASRISLADVSDVVVEAGVELSAVELITEEYDGSGLRSLAGAAGGSVLSASEPGRLVQLYEAVAAELLNRYLLTYETTRGGTTVVQVSLEAGGVDLTTAREIVLPATTGPDVVAPDPITASEPGFLGSHGGLFTGLALFFVALTSFLAWAFLRDREERVRLTERIGARAGAVRLPPLSRLLDRTNSMAKRRLVRSGHETRIYTELERAGIALRPEEFVVIATASTVAGFLLGALLGGLALGIAIAALVLVAFRVHLKMRAQRRLEEFAEQLGDTLQLITAGLRAGHSVLQAIDSVVNDAPAPTRDEFHRLVLEVRLGRDLREALWAMHRRIGNQDFEWVVQALEIHRDVGGDLAEILDTVATTIRDRTHLRRQVRALSAEGRISAMTLLALPFAAMGAMFLLNPGYLDPLFDTGVGVMLLAAGAGALALGFLWIRKLIRLEF